MTFAASSLTGEIRPFWVGFIDIAGDVVRVTTLPANLTITGTGDTDLDGQTFESLPAAFVEVTPVVHSDRGSDTVTATLSGIPGGDTAFLSAMANPANWRGRIARLWRGLADANFQPVVIEGYYTGYIMDCSFAGDPNGQTVSLNIENYLALLSQPRARTYQDQGEHDPADISAARIRAAANGIQSASGIQSGGGGAPFRLDEFAQLK
jgi:hypothetical protein